MMKIIREAAISGVNIDRSDDLEVWNRVFEFPKSY
jgi:hypothetical protein